MSKLAPYFVGAMAFILLNIAGQVQHSATPVSFYSLPQRILFVAYQVLFYLWKAVLPKMLSACYAYPQLLNGALPGIYYLSPVLLAAALFGVWLLRKNSRAIVAGPLFYLLTLSPVTAAHPV